MPKFFKNEDIGAMVGSRSFGGTGGGMSACEGKSVLGGAERGDLADCNEAWRERGCSSGDKWPLTRNPGSGRWEDGK